MHDIFGLRSDEGEQVYIWRNEDTELYFDKGDIVRFRVESEEWHDQSLLAPPAKGDTTSEIEKKVPYSIVVSTRASSVTGH
jgi:DNA-directed RNA polymerase III subunit RPC8